MAQPLPTYALLTVALGALSAFIVVGHATTHARVVAVAICIAMYCSQIHGCWAAMGCLSMYPSYVLRQKSCPLKYLGVSY